MIIGIIEGDPIDGVRKYLWKDGWEGDWHRTEEYLTRIRQFGLSRLADVCGLSREKLKALFNSHNLDTFVQLTSRGLGHLPSVGRLPE